MAIIVSSEVLLWLAVILLCVIVIALARQIGVLHERIAPVGALKVDHGPAVGQQAPVMTLATLTGGIARIGEALPAGSAQLLLFVSPDCPVCKKLIPIAKRFAQLERLSVVLVGDGDVRDQRRLIDRFGLQGLPFANSPEAGMRFGVGKLPYAVLIDDAGTVAAAGLVNTREHLESLVVAKDLGVASVQAYLRKRVDASPSALKTAAALDAAPVASSGVRG